MVDVNSLYTPNDNFNSCLSSLNSCDDLSFDDINYLQNFNDDDLKNFTENCEELNYSLILPDTPPETPINYNSALGSPGSGSIHSVNSPKQQPSPPATVVDWENNYGAPTATQVQNFANGIVHKQPCTLNSSIPTATIILPSTPTSGVVSSIAPAIFAYSHTLSTVDLNGFKPANGNLSLVYSKSGDANAFGANHSKPKSILPSQICPKLRNDCRTPNLNHKSILEARKLRNREAALNSRLKKKEYVDTLEANVKKLTKERNALLEENRTLKIKVKDLENQLCNRVRLDLNGNYEANNKRSKISFFAILFMVCFQVSPYLISMAPSGSSSDSQSLSSNSLLSTPSESEPSHQKVGRTLLWKREISPDYYQLDDGELPNRDSFNFTTMTYPNMTTGSVLCKEFFNVTESLRIENELRNLLTRFKFHEAKQPRPQSSSSPLHRRRSLRSSSSFGTVASARSSRAGSGGVGNARSKQNSKKLLFDSKYVPIPRLKMWMQKQKYDDVDVDDDEDYMSHQFERLPKPPSPSSRSFDYESLLATVHRRDDTFYYLSYPSKGHLILPPISNRTDVRPRFSFLIPSFYNLSLDGSPSAHKNSSDHHLPNSTISPQMYLLQIDCQVINTKVIMINEQVRFRNKTEKLAQNNKKLYKPESSNSSNSNSNQSRK